MDSAQLLKNYAAGPQLLREAIAGMTAEELRGHPVPGKWSTLELICHIADFEPIYGARMKRILAEENATLISGDPDLFAARLAYAIRDPEEELTIIESTRSQMVRILSTCTPADFERTGRHTADGPLALLEVLRRISGHIQHHLPFIAEKRRALAAH